MVLPGEHGVLELKQCLCHIETLHSQFISGSSDFSDPLFTNGDWWGFLLHKGCEIEWTKEFLWKAGELIDELVFICLEKYFNPSAEQCRDFDRNVWERSDDKPHPVADFIHAVTSTWELTKDQESAVDYLEALVKDRHDLSDCEWVLQDWDSFNVEFARLNEQEREICLVLYRLYHVGALRFVRSNFESIISFIKKKDKTFFTPNSDEIYFHKVSDEGALQSMYYKIRFGV